MTPPGGRGNRRSTPGVGRRSRRSAGKSAADGATPAREGWLPLLVLLGAESVGR
jgi:hypothetical protein